MCEPVTIATVSAMAIGTGMQIYGQAKGAQAEEEAGRLRADLARENAEMAEGAAADALKRGEYQALMQRLQGRVVESRKVAETGASGIDITSGSVVASVAGTAMVSRLDEETARMNAMREAWGLKKQASQFQKEGVMALQEGKARAKAMRWGAAATALTGAANVFAVGRRAPSPESSMGSFTRDSTTASGWSASLKPSPY